MNIDQLIGSREIKRSVPSKEKTLKSIEMSQEFLRRAKATYKVNIYNMAVVAAYSSMFHAARALLFKDGFKERSHWALVEYIRIVYSSSLGSGTINQFDNYRVVRHSTLYDLDKKEDPDMAKLSIEFAEEFLAKVKKLV